MATIEARGATSSATSLYNPQEMQYSVLHFILLAILSGLATIAVALRFWARRVQNQGLSLSDGLTVLGLIFALAETGVVIYGCCYPVQRKLGDVPQATGLRILFLSPILWITTVTTVRAAVIFLYFQIFPLRLFRTTFYSVLAVNLVFGASAVIADCLICRPITYRWQPELVQGSCGNQKLLDMCIAIVNVLQDVVIVVLPIPILWGTQLAKTKKVALSCMFGIGILVCGITIYRVQATSTIGDPTSAHAQKTYCDIALLSSLEALLGIICACLPFLKPLLHKLRASLSERTSNQSEPVTSSSTPNARQASGKLGLRSEKHYIKMSESGMDAC